MLEYFGIFLFLKSNEIRRMQMSGYIHLYLIQLFFYQYLSMDTISGHNIRSQYPGHQ